MKTKNNNDKTGHQIIFKDGKVIKENSVNVEKGTSITAKNLFYNIPVRRNFLKSDTVELRHIIDEFVRCAIANPEINFILVNEENEIYNLEKSNLKKRIISVFKKNYENNLITCNEKYGAISIDGYIGRGTIFICK